MDNNETKDFFEEAKKIMSDESIKLAEDKSEEALPKARPDYVNDGGIEFFRREKPLTDEELNEQSRYRYPYPPIYFSKVANPEDFSGIRSINCGHPKIASVLAKFLDWLSRKFS